LGQLPLFGAVTGVWGSYRCLGQLPLFGQLSLYIVTAILNTQTQCVRKDVDFMNGEADGIYNYHCVLKASAFKVPGIFQTLAPVEKTQFVG